MKPLPKDVKPYKRTPTFDENTLPDGLRNDHATKDGVWGVIHIEAGCLRYEISDSGAATELTPETANGIVEPTVRHRVTPVGHVRFYVEFHRA